MSSVTDSDGRTTTYQYDASEQYLMSVSYFDGRTINYTYDTGSSVTTEHALLSVTNPDGSHSFFDYDSLGHIADTKSDSGADQITYSSSQGQVSATTLLGGTTSYSFNVLGLLAKVQERLGNNTYYSYDSNFDLTQVIDAAGQVYTNSYDVNGNLLSSTNPLGQTVSFRYSSP